MLVYPAALAALAGLAWWRKVRRGKSPGLTAEREFIYKNAMNEERDPTKLRKLADEYEKADPTLRPQADMLRKRAALRDAPADVKQARSDAFRKGMKSTDPAGVESLADAYEKTGALGAARALRAYAKGLRLTDAIEIEKVAKTLDKGQNEKVGAASLRERAAALAAKTSVVPPSVAAAAAVTPDVTAPTIPAPAEDVKPAEPDETIKAPADAAE